jgi:PAS domain S-box-containing protein
MAPPRVSGARRLAGLFQQAREPVFVLDDQRRLVYVNAAWEELTGHPAAAVMGLECLPHGPARDGDLAGMGGSFSPPPEALAGRPCGGPSLIIHADGERRWRRLEFWPLHDGRGGLAGLLGFVRAPDEPAHASDSVAQRLRAELAEIRDRLRHEPGLDTLMGTGAEHRRLLDQVRAAAATYVPVLILGEPGTGKRTVARTIHGRGPRAQGSFLPYDCAALPPEVLERELFGFSLGRGDRRLAVPEGSTLLLVDILDLPRDLQGRLAEAPLGAGWTRLLATATLDPETARDQDRLRPDLYYVLTTFVIRLTPLRQRLEDLPLLAQHLLERANLRKEHQLSGIAPEAMGVLAAYDWPGNLRELARVIEEAHGRAQGDVLGTSDLPASIRGNLGSAYTPPPMPPPLTPLDDLLTQLERRLIEGALARARQNKSRAAELLDISRPRLYRRIKELNIPDVPEDGAATETLTARPRGGHLAPGSAQDGEAPHATADGSGLGPSGVAAPPA